MPREPSFYINVPSRIDPTAAPEGKDSLVVLVPVGHLSPGKKGSDPDDEGQDQDWPGLVERARKQIIEIVEERLGMTGLRDMILWEEVNTPLTCKLPCIEYLRMADTTGREKFNLTHGSILGITHDFFNVLSFRHQSRHPKLSGAYFVGASAHPGTGVSLPKLPPV
jgi:phytoene desaturase (3,4-didehydrolycopene-forming)